MKYRFIILCLTLYSICNSCKKTSAVTLYGKWNIVNDSIASSIGIAYYHQNYIGTLHDYFDFRTNDTLYIKENELYDTVPYEFPDGNKIILQHMGIMDNGTTLPSDILQLTTHNAIIDINSNVFNNPAGVYRRTISLSR